MSKTRFEYLAQPISIGQVRLKNRMMKNATSFFWDDPSTGGHIDDKYIALFEALAKGGAALVSSAVAPYTTSAEGEVPGLTTLNQASIPGWSRLAEAVHKYDCLCFHSLFHLGPMIPFFGYAPPGASASALSKESSPIPRFDAARALTVAELEDVVDTFARGAENMKKAGLDGTEVNGASNHLLNDFLSRAWNKRTDEYGTQTIENRTRLFTNIIREIKRRNGQDWPVIALMNGAEIDLQDGITIEESTQFAQKFVEAGADALEVRAEYYTYTGDNSRRDSLHFPDYFFYPGHEGSLDPIVYGKGHGAQGNIKMAAQIKKAVDVPVIVIGKMDWETGDRAVKKGYADVISMNRRLIADPDASQRRCWRAGRRTSTPAPRASSVSTPVSTSSPWFAALTPPSAMSASTRSNRRPSRRR